MWALAEGIKANLVIITDILQMHAHINICHF